MHTLLLILSLTFAPAIARTNNPELVDWAEFQMMTEPHREGYLRAVAEALNEFEMSAADAFATDNFASIPFWREFFEQVIDEAAPQAHATKTTDGVDCVRNDVKFSVPAGQKSNIFCVTWSTGPSSRANRCLNNGSDQSSYSDVHALMHKCDQQFKQSPEAVAALNFGKTPVANNSAAAAETAGVNGPVNKPLAGFDANVTNSAFLNKHCDAVSAANRKKARDDYRRGGQPACLIAGTISSYGKDNSSTCAPKTSEKDESGKTTSCSATNTYDKNGAAKAVGAFKRTICQSTLYCAKDRAPFCVEANGRAFDNCDRAVKQNKAKLQFGAACVGNDLNRYKKLESDLVKVCDNDQARDLLCNDCKKLKAKLDKAESDHAAAGSAPGAPAGTPSGTGATRG